jgi:hypothetical protein
LLQTSPYYMLLFNGFKQKGKQTKKNHHNPSKYWVNFSSKRFQIFLVYC